MDPGLADHGGVLSVTQVLQTNLKQARDSPRDLTYEAQRIKDLEKELRELRRSNVILRSASACLSRRSVSARPLIWQYIDSRKEDDAVGTIPCCPAGLLRRPPRQGRGRADGSPCLARAGAALGQGVTRARSAHL